jgi:hypothetical protein
MALISRRLEQDCLSVSETRGLTSLIPAPVRLVASAEQFWDRKQKKQRRAVLCQVVGVSVAVTFEVLVAVLSGCLVVVLAEARVAVLSAVLVVVAG